MKSSGRAEDNVISKMTSIVPPAGTLRLRTSRIPPLFVPPLGVVLEMSAPGGELTILSEPGSNAGKELRLPRSS
jgi:hypothetical protein